MAWPIVKVTSGGIAVTEATNGFGTPVEVAANGYGTPVTYVSSGGIPVSTGAVSPPAGYAFFQGKNADGSYTNLSGLQTDASRVTLAGKTA